MSRTHKKRPYRFHRQPRGGKQARSSYEANGGRQKAIPPDVYDDLNHDDQCWIAYNVAFKLHQKGWANEKIIRHIARKYNLTYHRVRENIVPKDNDHFSWWWRNCKCDKCLAKKKTAGFLVLYGKVR